MRYDYRIKAALQAMWKQVFNPRTCDSRLISIEDIKSKITYLFCSSKADSRRSRSTAFVPSVETPNPEQSSRSSCTFNALRAVAVLGTSMFAEVSCYYFSCGCLIPNKTLRGSSALLADLETQAHLVCWSVGTYKRVRVRLLLRSTGLRVFSNIPSTMNAS